MHHRHISRQTELLLKPLIGLNLFKTILQVQDVLLQPFLFILNCLIEEGVNKIRISQGKLLFLNLVSYGNLDWLVRWASSFHTLKKDLELVWGLMARSLVKTLTHCWERLNGLLLGNNVQEGLFIDEAFETIMMRLNLQQLFILPAPKVRWWLHIMSRLNYLTPFAEKLGRK